MAFDVSGLTAYVEQEHDTLLVKALFSSKSATLFQSAGQVLPGVKSSKDLPILSNTVYLQADGCGYTSSGTTTMSKRNLAVGAVKVEETLCPKTLEDYWYQKKMAAGSATEVPFGEVIADAKVKQINEKIETMIWVGDTNSGDPNLNKWDGFITILEALGFGGAGDPIKGDANSTNFTSITTSNIDDIVDQIYTLMPDAVLERDDAFIAMGTDNFRTYCQWLRSANLFHYAVDGGAFAAGAAPNFQYHPGTNVKVYGLPGLSGTNKMVGSYLANFFIGTDLMNEEEEFKMWYSQDNDEVRTRVTFKYGCQIAFPDQVVFFDLTDS